MKKDKLYHFGICLIVTLLFGFLINPITGAVGALGLGFGKEYGDSKAPGNSWDNWDLLADTIGVVVGLTIIAIIGVLL